MTSALNARTAADAIRQREFDLVLLDINLPDGNGFELCKLIKPQHPDTIVIFLTANDQESDQIRGYEVGKYEIGDECVECGACAGVCPVGAIKQP